MHSVTGNNPCLISQSFYFFPFLSRVRFPKAAIIPSSSHVMTLASFGYTESEEHVEKIKDDESSGKLRLIKLEYSTAHNQWDK